MKKLQIGTEIVGLDGKAIKGKDHGMTVRDLLVQLYPVMGGQKRENALSIQATMQKIYDCKEDVIEVEDHDFAVLKAALDGVDALVWVQAALAKVFE